MHEYQSTPAVGPTFIQNVHGGTAAQRFNVSQNVGVQPDQLAGLVRQLRGLAGEVPEQAREGFLQDVEVLEDTERAPEQRMRAGQRIVAALNAVPALQAAVEGGEAIIESVSQVVGALGG
ncbi:hypothetical protein ACFVYE_33365 [Streptomyces sp. NPDC058239]|uniref:hypothetical protein n=1 Tax=unclassified Streptomyces TaxID=2593676 RepID=UPI0036468B0F